MQKMKAHVHGKNCSDGREALIEPVPRADHLDQWLGDLDEAVEKSRRIAS